MSEGRLHVHLNELKQPFVDKIYFVKGDISEVVRTLIRAYVEDRLMIISDEVLEFIEKEDFNKAVEAILPGLQRLRAERLQAGQKKTADRKTKKSAAGKKKGGVQTKEEKQVDDLYKTLMGGFK